jgi:anti-anti-sigma factor
MISVCGTTAPVTPSSWLCIEKEIRMPIVRLETNVRYQPGLAIVDLCGELTAPDEAALDRGYSLAERENPSAILLNFREVTYMNSAGIALIVALLSRARTAGRRVVAYGLAPHFLETFQITRLVDFMSVFPDEASALAAAAPVAAARAS